MTYEVGKKAVIRCDRCDTTLQTSYRGDHLDAAQAVWAKAVRQNWTRNNNDTHRCPRCS